MSTPMAGTQCFHAIKTLVTTGSIRPSILQLTIGLSPTGPTKAVASVNMVYDNSPSVYYPDSGATNHVTNDVHNVQNICAYEGNK